MKKLSHTDAEGKARMVDVGYKDIQQRVAKATGFIRMEADTLGLVLNNQMKKGDVLTVAEIAGIQAAKQTPQLIPLAHNIVLDRVLVQAIPEKNGIRVTGEVSCSGRTGAEMEALTAVSIALLTIYDMCKAVDKNMQMEGIKLIEKTKKDILA